MAIEIVSWESTNGENLLNFILWQSDLPLIQRVLPISLSVPESPADLFSPNEAASLGLR